MAEKDKKYYWLKLKKDFFKRHDIQIIEDMENGKDYILFYLKLLCESVDHEGNLRFSEEIPYNDKMLATITHTNIDIVRSAVKLFTSLNMMTLLDDATLYMNKIEDMIGSETYWAQKKREKRAELNSVGQFPTLSNEIPTCPSKSIEKDKEKDKEKEKEKEKDKENNETKVSNEFIQSIIDSWNSLSLSKLTKIAKGSARYKSINARVMEYGEDSLLQAINLIKESDFLKGVNDKGWVITFDWFIKPNNFIKVLEGNYTTRKRGHINGSNEQHTTEQEDDVERALRKQGKSITGFKEANDYDF